MRGGIPRLIPFLVVLAALFVGATTTRAEETVTVYGTACDGASVEDARVLADEARRDGAHHRAAECYRVAGEPLEADRSLAKAFAEANAVNSKRAAATLEEAKSQAKRIREAFRGRRS